MLAYGPASPNGTWLSPDLIVLLLQTNMYFCGLGRLLKHSILPLTTASPVLLTSLDAARFSNVNDLYKSHGKVELVGSFDEVESLA